MNDWCLEYWGEYLWSHKGDRLYQSITLICRISTVVAAAFRVRPPSFPPFLGFLDLLMPSLGAPFLFLLSFCSAVCKREASACKQLTGFNETCQKCFYTLSLRVKLSSWLIRLPGTSCPLRPAAPLSCSPRAALRCLHEGSPPPLLPCLMSIQMSVEQRSTRRRYPLSTDDTWENFTPSHQHL